MTLRFIQIPAHALAPGMYVKTPPIVREHWPDAPAVLRVHHWDWEEGETDLQDPDGPDSIDLNALDYPRMLAVVT